MEEFVCLNCGAVYDELTASHLANCCECGSKEIVLSHYVDGIITEAEEQGIHKDWYEKWRLY